MDIFFILNATLGNDISFFTVMTIHCASCPGNFQWLSSNHGIFVVKTMADQKWHSDILSNSVILVFEGTEIVSLYGHKNRMDFEKKQRIFLFFLSMGLILVENKIIRGVTHLDLFNLIIVLLSLINNCAAITGSSVK